jgi:hypothetical protein
MSGVEGAEREDYDEREAGVGGRLPAWCSAFARFDTGRCVCRMKT